MRRFSDEFHGVGAVAAGAWHVRRGGMLKVIKRCMTHPWGASVGGLGFFHFPPESSTFLTAAVNQVTSTNLFFATLRAAERLAGATRNRPSSATVHQP